MKELTIEEKAQRYDKVLEWATEAHKVCDGMLKEDLEHLFPELKESEDEKTRKEILDYIIKGSKSFYDVQQYGKEKFEKWIAWLEKQGEKESVTCPICGWEIEKQAEQKPADKVEPKFKVGDWVIYDHRTYQIVELPQGRLINASLSRNGKTEQVPLPYCEKWTIKDAKDGDVLSYENEIFIVKKSVNLNILYYCCYDREHFIIDSIYSLTIDDIDNIRPATKEQRDTLEKAMADAGYIWDSKSKRLLSLKAGLNYTQNPAWSEEDINMLQSILDEYKSMPIEKRNWLKSLKDRNTWKPSEEQIIELRHVISGCSYDIEPLVEIEEQLKKLREE